MIASRWRERIALGALVLAGAIVLLAPQALLLLPNPGPTPVESVASAGRGVYISQRAGSWRLFPRAEPVPSAPHDAPEVRPVGRLLVVSRVSHDVDGYRVTRMGSDTDFSRFSRGGRDVSMPLEGLPKGSYELEAPRDSMYGGNDYFYFVVR